MKTLFRIFSCAMLLTLIGYSGNAQTMVDGYVKKNGTYVAPHYRTEPNKTKLDNWSTKPNVNPFTGTTGTKTANDPYSTPVVVPAPVYPSKPIPVYPTYAPSQNSAATQCMGLTKKGYQCSRMTKDPSGYCYQHQ